MSQVAQFTVSNFTKYRTDDLVALVQSVVDQIPPAAKDAKGHPKMREYLIVPNPPVIQFREYTGDPEYEWAYNGKERIRGNKKWIGRTIYRRPLDLILLAPEAIYDNPVEALTARTGEYEVVPDFMVKQVADHIANWFAYFANSRGVWQTSPTLAYTAGVRVAKAGEQKQAKRTRKDQAREKLENVTRELHWDMKAARNKLEVLKTQAMRIRSAGVTLKVDFDFPELDAVEAQLAAFEVSVDRAIDAARKA